MGKPAVGRATEFESWVWMLASGCCLCTQHKFEESTGAMRLGPGSPPLCGQSLSLFCKVFGMYSLILLIGGPVMRLSLSVRDDAGPARLSGPPVCPDGHQAVTLRMSVGVAQMLREVSSGTLGQKRTTFVG